MIIVLVHPGATVCDARCFCNKRAPCGPAFLCCSPPGWPIPGGASMPLACLTWPTGRAGRRVAAWGGSSAPRVQAPGMPGRPPSARPAHCPRCMGAALSVAGRITDKLSALSAFRHVNACRKHQSNQWCRSVRSVRSQKVNGPGPSPTHPGCGSFQPRTFRRCRPMDLLNRPAPARCEVKRRWAVKVRPGAPAPATGQPSRAGGIPGGIECDRCPTNPHGCCISADLDADSCPPVPQ